MTVDKARPSIPGISPKGDSPHALSVGTRFGRYEILSLIGAGGMGEVYRALDHDLNRNVAVKLLPSRFASDPGRMSRFAQEARAASSLNHPNIITIHEIGETSGLPFIVMEFVDGETLRLVIAGGRLTVRRSLDLAAQVAEGLAKAHAAGIVHRDLKPENIMVTPDGFVKILDFGLAKLWPIGREAASEAETVTDTQLLPNTDRYTILGTVGYMSPEQAAGRSVDFRSDQFSLGTILYEMATGCRAFLRESAAQTLAAIIEKDPQSISEINPAFPAPVRWIIERCLEKDPVDRYASTLDLARELRKVREHLTEASAPSVTSGAPAPSKPRSRLRLRLWHKVATILAILAGLMLVTPVLEIVQQRLHLLPLPAQKRIAILPVRNPGGTVQERAMCEGLLDYLVARLSEIEKFQKAFWVVPAAEVRRQGAAADRDIRRGLGVTLALDITVQRSGERTLMSAVLRDTEQQRVLRSTTREIPSEASLLDQTVDAVIDMLDVEIDSDARATLRAGTTTVVEASTLYAQALAYQPYEQARTMLDRYDQRQNLEQAVNLLNAALTKDPRYALAHAGLGEVYLRLWMLTKDPEFARLAEDHCHRALDLDSLVAPVWVTLGMLHSQTGKPDEALSDFERALARAPGSAEVLRERGVALQRLGRFEEAEKSYRAAIARRPDSWAAYNYLGTFLFSRGRNREAEAAFRQALKLAPDNARVWSNLGAVLHRLDRYDEAEAAWEKSVSFHPTASALSNLATRRFFQGQYAEAARRFEAATKLAKRDYRIWRNLGAAYYWVPGERDRAAVAYRTAADLAEQERRLDQRNAPLLADLADCLALLGESKRARTLLAEALKLEPGNNDVTQMAVGIYEALGERDAALRCLDRALKEGYSRDQIEHDPFLAGLRADPRYLELGKGKTAAGGKNANNN
jgi:serine/threonine protein kinase/tetratricopeptide (TPR) repeat protein